jgi:predicted nucleic acid-binding protein
VGVGGRLPRLAIDSMVLIYHFEDHPAFGPSAASLLHAAEEDRGQIVVSMLARLEVLVAPQRQGRGDLCRRYREMFEGFPNLTVVAVDAEVVELASDLRAEHALRTPDAIHLATALHLAADAFVTEDRRHFPDEIRGLPVLTLEAAAERMPAP